MTEHDEIHARRKAVDVVRPAWAEGRDFTAGEARSRHRRVFAALAELSAN